MDNLTHAARSGAFVLIGLGVLGLQQAHHRRRELEHLLRSVDPAVDARITKLQEDVGRRVHDVESVVSRAEEQLPPPVREAVHTIRTHLGDLLAP